MGRERKVRQSRGGATTGPDAKACVPAASRIHDNTATSDPARAAPSEAPHISTEAEILLGVAMWLAAARDWFEEEAMLARGRLGLEPGDTAADDASLTLRMPDVEKMLIGLRESVRCLDRLAIDPARIRALVETTPPQGAPSGTIH